jgi:regulatory protein
MDAKEALNRAAAYCSRQERCIADVERKLQDWEVEQNEFGAIIEWLLTEKFIDEERFTSFYVRDKFKFNGWGKVKIRWSLKQKNITGTALENALNNIDNNAYTAKLQKLLEVKLKQLKGKDPYKTKASLIRFAQSRGFEAEIIYPLVEKLIKNI